MTDHTGAPVAAAPHRSTVPARLDRLPEAVALPLSARADAVSAAVKGGLTSGFKPHVRREVPSELRHRRGIGRLGRPRSHLMQARHVC